MVRLHNILSAAGVMPGLQNPVAGFQPACISRNLAKKWRLRVSVRARRNRWGMECFRPSFSVVISPFWLNASARRRPLAVPPTGEYRPTIRAGGTIPISTGLAKGREDNAKTSRIEIEVARPFLRTGDQTAKRYNGEFIQALAFETFRFPT